MKMRTPYFVSALATCSLLSAQAVAQPPTPADPAPAPDAAPEPPPPEAPAPAPAETPAAEAPSAEPAPSPAEAPAPEPAPMEPPAPEPAPPPPAAVEPPPPATEEPPPEEPPPDSVTPLKINGSFFTRYELREGYEEHASLTHPRLHREGDTFVYRARLGIQTNPVSIGDGQSVMINFVPQAAGTQATQGAPPTIGDVYDLGVYEAFTRLQSDAFAFDVGRFMLNYGDAMIIGNLGWNETARAFQGARLRLKGDSGYWTDVFVTQISEGSGTTGAAFDGDRYFYGIYSALGPAIGKLDLDVYLLGQSFGKIDGVVTDDTTDPPTTADQAGATFFTLGTRIKQKIESFDYRLEAGLQFGSRPVTGADAVDKFAYHADGGIGISPAPGLRIGIGGLVASGDSDPADDTDNAWDELFPTGHAFLGLTDAFGARTNALGGNAEISYKASDAWILKLQGHALGRLEENAAGETYTGTELDTHIVHPIGKGAQVRAMYALFMPNEDYWGESDSVHFFELEYGYNF